MDFTKEAQQILDEVSSAVSVCWVGEKLERTREYTCTCIYFNVGELCSECVLDQRETREHSRVLVLQHHYTRGALLLRQAVMERVPGSVCVCV